MKFTKYDGTMRTFPKLCSHIIAIKGDEFETSNELVTGEVLGASDGELVVYPQSGRENPVECIYWCYVSKHPEGKEYKTVLPANIRDQYK